jgi:hypothetical protein
MIGIQNILGQTSHLAINNMRLRNIIIKVSLIFCVGKIFGQTNQADRLLIPFLDDESQSNIIVTVSDLDGDGQPCPMEYTNLISNTNLFSVAEQKLLTEIPFKYKDVTTNSGPAGTVLISLYKTNIVIKVMDRTVKTENWVADFQYTNSEAREEIFFDGQTMTASRFQIKPNNGYTAVFFQEDGMSALRFMQVKQGLMDGLLVEFHGDHCVSYQHEIQGKAIGKFFMWNPLNNNLGLEAEFKEPYDLEKHRLQPQ